MKSQSAKPRVLIVDDRPANRLAFKTLLEAQYAVSTAESGPQALELTLRDDYAVILLDVRMPGMDGFEVSQLLRQRGRTRHTPIIFLSAYDKTPEQLKKGYAAGATDFIFSPVDEEVLKLKVATYVAIHLRNEALGLKMDRLERALRELKESGRPAPLTKRQEVDVRLLEEEIGDLKKEIRGAPPERE
jgi:CheY-like chemotaxis protein